MSIFEFTSVCPWVVVWEGEEVLRAPTGSLFRRGKAWAVFALEGGRARLREVSVGQRNGLEAQVHRPQVPFQLLDPTAPEVMLSLCQDKLTRIPRTSYRRSVYGRLENPSGSDLP